MRTKPEVGQLWSLQDQEVVVCLTKDASAAHNECFIGVIIHSDEQSPFWKKGQELIVHTSTLACEWTVKPLSGVAR